MRIKVKEEDRGNLKKDAVNKSFKIPKRRKSKNQIGLYMVVSPTLKVDEAREICDSGVQMGLIPVGNETITIEAIRERVQKA